MCSVCVVTDMARLEWIMAGGLGCALAVHLLLLSSLMWSYARGTRMCIVTGGPLETAVDWAIISFGIIGVCLGLMGVRDRM